MFTVQLGRNGSHFVQVEPLKKLKRGSEYTWSGMCVVHTTRVYY